MRWRTCGIGRALPAEHVLSPRSCWTPRRALIRERAKRARTWWSQNNRKRYDGYLAALLDPEIWAALEARDRKLRDAMAMQIQIHARRVRSDQAGAGRDHEEPARLQLLRAGTAVRRISPTARFLGISSSMRAFSCAQPMSARSQTERESRNFATAIASRSSWTIFHRTDARRSREITLTDSLTDIATAFGADDPLVKKVLAGKSPHARAVELVTGTKLKDVAIRKDV